MRTGATLLLAALAAFAGDGIDLHRWEDASVATGTRFTVRTDTWPEIARSLVRTLDLAGEAFEERFGPLPDGADGPMPIWLFRSRAGYQAHGAGVAGAVGHFDAAFDRAALVWDGSCGDEGWPIAVHEACHHFLRRRFPEATTPSWYTEGIACFFEGECDYGSPRRLARLRVDTARAAHAAGEARLEELLSARASIRTGRLQVEPWTPSRFYALAWSLVHMLSTHPRHREGFALFERHLFAERTVPALRERRARELLERFCGPLDRIERDWHRALEEFPASRERAAAPAVEPGDLAHPSPFARYRALHRLGERAHARVFRPGLRACLDDPDLLVRLAATRSVARAVEPADLPALVRSLGKGDPALARAALDALADPVARPAADAVVARAGDADPLQAAALGTLAAMEAPEAWPLLRRALVRPDLSGRVRARCASALALDPWAEPLLRRAALDDAEDDVRRAARAALIGQALRPSAWDGREALLDSWMRSLIVHEALRDHPRVKALALSPIDPAADHFVAPVDGATPERVLLSLLSDDRTTDPQRAEACRLLGEARAREAVPALRALCRPVVPDRVRLEAVRALVAITGETRGFVPGQPARAREAAYRAWAAPPPAGDGR